MSYHPSANRATFDRYLTTQEEKQLFRYMKKQAGPLARRDRAWMLLLRATGIRVGTLAQLTLGDARDALATERLHLRDEISKGGRGYSLRLFAAGLDALRELIAARRAMGMPMIEDDALVVSQRGTPLAVRSYQARMQMWVNEAGLKIKASPHWWRHTLGKRAIAEAQARGAADPLAHAQVVLGHARRQTTEIYTLPDRSDIEDTLRGAQPRGM